VFQALELGALDFIAKPTRHISPELASIRDDLIGKVLLFRHLRMDSLQQARAPVPVEVPKRAPPMLPGTDMRLLCIGASTGGPPAVQLLLAQIPADAPVAILICQHMPAKFTRAFAERLDRTARFSVKEAEDGDAIVAGNAYIAPGGKNMVIQRVDGKRVIRLQEGGLEDRYVPSIDRLFSTAAETFGSKVLAVVLTGMGTDGKVGAAKVRERGGLVIAESKESAVIYGMPKEVAEAGLADHLLALPKISEAIADYCAGQKIGKKT
jgi:two-component system chemotaxis response regulator CheB